MKKTKMLMMLVALIAVVGIAPAVADELPKVLKVGFDQYSKEGPKAAIESWTKGSAIEGSKEALSQANSFRQIQDFYGNYIGYNLVKVKEHSNSSTVYFMEMKFEKGNVFAKFYTYKKADGNVVVTTFNFNTNPDLVWPASLVVGCTDK